jgi:hypothetical protein
MLIACFFGCTVYIQNTEELTEVVPDFQPIAKRQAMLGLLMGY